MLLPFLPLSPHLLPMPASLVPSPDMLPVEIRGPRSEGLGGMRRTGLGAPPRMAETDEWEDRACFWMVEVIAMHSEMTRETGSTVTETGRLRYCIREDCGWSLRLRPVASGSMLATGPSWLLPILPHRAVHFVGSLQGSTSFVELVMAAK